MDPVVNAAGAAGSHILGNFALMVREHEVHSAAVDIELISKVFLTHYGALKVPAGETVAPGAGPAHDMLRLCLFPECKVIRSTFVALAVKAAGAFQGCLQGAAGKDAVIVVTVVFLDIEVDAAVTLVGITGCKDFLDGLYLLNDVP